MYRILSLCDGSFRAECQIQDGTERINCTNLIEAVQWLIKSARVLNHDYIREDDIERLSQTPGGDRDTTMGVTPAEMDVIDALRRCEIVTIPRDDKRIKFRLTDDECDMVVSIREGELIVKETNAQH